MIHITECPRDAMQGLDHFVPTDQKIAYLNSLLQVGFDTLDFGSFVSPKAVPQMADTLVVLDELAWKESKTQLSAIVVNARGAETACSLEGVDILGYPFSISETFQLRNSRKTISESLELTKRIMSMCKDSGKELMVYLSMGFGNPYGDPWSISLLEEWVEKMVRLGIQRIVLADTVGNSQPEQIGFIYSTLIPAFPENEICAHFHSAPKDSMAKITSAYDAGCRHFDVAMLGFGGCPFAKDELVGNISTESLVAFCAERDISTHFNVTLFQSALNQAQAVFHQPLDQ